MNNIHVYMPLIAYILIKSLQQYVSAIDNTTNKIELIYGDQQSLTNPYTICVGLMAWSYLFYPSWKTASHIRPLHVGRLREVALHTELKQRANEKMKVALFLDWTGWGFAENQSRLI